MEARGQDLVLDFSFRERSSYNSRAKSWIGISMELYLGDFLKPVFIREAWMDRKRRSNLGVGVLFILVGALALVYQLVPGFQDLLDLNFD